MALKFGTPGAPYAPRQRGVRVVHSGKRTPRIVDISTPAPRIEPAEVAKALGARLIGDLSLVEYFFVAGDSLTLTLCGGVRFQLKEDGFLVFSVDNGRELVFKEDETKKVYIIDDKGTSQTLWEK